jgi:hypothetical protein
MNLKAVIASRACGVAIQLPRTGLAARNRQANQ